MMDLDYEKISQILIYGCSALIVLLMASSIASVIESIPLVPQLMEVIGFGCTLWFSYQYLIFKEKRDELFQKFDEIKTQILG